MDGFIREPLERRRLICEQAEARMNLPAISLEKDFWVCWTLRELFSIPEWNRSLTFKGGTSFSKCWDLISRFSEDIDIVIDREYLGFGGSDSPEEALSNKKRKRRLADLKTAAQSRIYNDLEPALADRVEASLLESDDW